MAKAHQAPTWQYQRRLIITAHALERYRERVETEHVARSDADLGNLLDERIHASPKHQTVLDDRNPGEVTRVFEVEHRDGSIYYAVVREQAVVTVLDADMLRLNFDNGSWKTGPMNTPFTRASLRGVVPEMPTAQPGVIKRSPADPKTIVLPMPAGIATASLANAIADREIATLGDESAIKPSDVTNAGITLAEAMVRRERAALRISVALDAVRAAEVVVEDVRRVYEIESENVTNAQAALQRAVDQAVNPTKEKSK